MSSVPEPSPRLRDSYRAMPRTAWVLFAGTFVLRLGSFVFPFLALYLTENGLSVTEAGLAIAGYGIGAVLAQLTGGLLTDRIGRRNAIALSMITSSVLVLLLLQARSLPAVLAIVVVYSFFAELHRPASGALIADLVPSEHRVAAYAFNRLLFNLSFAIGLALGGLVAEESFTLLFVLDAATSATFGVISLLGEKQARLIEQKLLATIGPEEMERRRLVCGDAYSFQGDERHVMFISMVRDALVTSVTCRAPPVSL